MAKETQPDQDGPADDQPAPSAPESVQALPPSNQSEPRSFPVVVVGASAGGLKPLTGFLEAVPPDAGMAYLVIQHRKAGSDSALAELIGRQARIEVVDAEQGQALEPDRAYVIPPARYVSAPGDQFDLGEPPTEHRLPIDYLLRAVAEDMGERAIAVILSGTGTDGTQGVGGVEAAGGLVAVQDPRTAEHRGMPESAIDTGEADFVLATADIPGRLMEYARQSAGVPEPTAARQPRELARLLALLRERRGHDFSQYKSSTVLRRVQRRMAVHRLNDYRQYEHLLRDDPRELSTLFRELLIRVSAFFRDPEAFAALERDVVPALVRQGTPDEPVRVWVPACSTGEEAYSIAILLNEEMRRQDHYIRVQVFATDIDPSAIAIARAGRYPESIALDVSRKRLQRYFHGSDSHYEVNRAIRETVVFAEQSLIKDPPFSTVSLVSCRNLLIYLEPALQKKVFPLFHYALTPGGFLFLGTSESLVEAEGMFRALDRKARIFVRRDASRAAGDLPQPLISPASGGSAPQRKGEGGGRPRSRIVEIAERVLLRDHVPACVIVDANNQIVYFRGATGRFLEPATGASSLDILRMVREELARDLRDVIRRARRGKEPVLGEPVELRRDGSKELIRLQVTPVDEPEIPEGSLLVAFEQVQPRQPIKPDDAAPSVAGGNARMALLEQELDETREDLRGSIEELESSNEELQSSNEELQSSNEELQSSNEELETSREELQSVNEELHTLNGELEGKVEELSTAHDDINNLLASTEIGIIFVDTDLRIKRFTPAIRGVIPLIDSDLGRPLTHFVNNLVSHDLSGELDRVLHTGADHEQAVLGRDGHWHLMRIRPYWTGGDRVTGAVVAFIDLSADPELARMTWFKVALGRSPVMVLLADLSGRIEYANSALGRITGLDTEELAGANVNGLLQNLDAEREKAMRASLRAGKSWSGELRCRRRQGDPIPVAAKFVPVCGTGEDISHAAVYLDNLAEVGSGTSL